MEGKSSMNVDGGVALAKKRRIGTFESVVRILVFVFTLPAAVILGVNKQTKVVPIKVLDSLPPLNVPVSAKWNYLSPFLFFVVANAIACSYAAFSLILSLANGDGKSNLGLLVFVFDTVMMGLLFSANGAAAAIGLLGFKGNSHSQWNRCAMSLANSATKQPPPSASLCSEQQPFSCSWCLQPNASRKNDDHDQTTRIFCLLSLSLL